MTRAARRRLATASIPLVVLIALACATALLCAPAPVAALAQAGAAADAPLTDSAPNGDREPSATADPGAVVDTFVASGTSVRGLAVLGSQGGVQTFERYYGTGPDGEVGPETVFEWGRCSDLIVWACVAYLVDEGALSLDDRVGQLLPDGVTLPEGYDRLTLANLMDHTAGLDVAMVGSRSSIPADTASVVPAFALFDVEADRDPGDEVAYTPYDALLAAAMVEQVAGEPFCSYAAATVFAPLGMASATLAMGGPALGGGYAEKGQGVSVDPARLGWLGVRTSSVQTTSSGSVFTCSGTAADLLRLAQGLLALDGCGDDGGPALFDDSASSALFSVSRTYPGLGIARVAHGMFAFPFSTGVFGISASTSSGYSSAVYMSKETGTAFVALANEGERFDLVQGIPRVLVGRTDALSAQPSAPTAATWAGAYQDASKPNHGPAKLLTALTRTVVSTNAQGTLTFDGLTATSLGAGVYSIDTAKDQDVYRFHVSLGRGNEFSRATSDSYAVPNATLAVEGLLLAGADGGVAVCVIFALADAVRLMRARFNHQRARTQLSVMALAVATCAAFGVACAMILGLAGGMAPAALGAGQAIEAIYVAFALAVSGWIVFSRVRSCRYSRAQRASSWLVVLAALAIVTNLVYWEMLP